MTDDLIFEPLPTRGVGRVGRPEAKWAVALRARPGEWARIPLAYDAGRASKGRYRAKGFELACRTVDGEKRVYGRYVGSPE